MIVPLIPLFLVANVSVNDSRNWEYGPEAIYNVQYDAFARPRNLSMTQFATTNSTMKLKCRPDKLVLNCRFREDKLVRTLLKSGLSHVLKDTEDFGQDGPGDGGFQLRFGSEGLDEIVVPSSITPGKLDIVRALVGQLNIGWNLSADSAESVNLTVLEKSAAGECEATCELTYAPNPASRESTTDSYELIATRGPNEAESTLREIRKTRNLEKCHFRADYFYGSREARRDPPSKVNTTLMSSTSRMIIQKRDFVSWTENVVDVDDNAVLRTRTTITERITLSLEDIVPAVGPMPEISEPARASVFPTTWLCEDSSEESQESVDQSSQSDD